MLLPSLLLERKPSRAEVELTVVVWVAGVGVGGGGVRVGFGVGLGVSSFLKISAFGLPTTEEQEMILVRV